VRPYGETCPTFHDAYQAMNVKAEAGSDAEEVEDPVPITYLQIKAEPEVSCMCTVRQITQMWRSVACLSDLYHCLCT
jgi:CRISPR/Cas system CMR subunit Cmr6 (Cas7 group RAMP superfamily)